MVTGYRKVLDSIWRPKQGGLYRHLKSRGRIDHDQLFFKHDGAPIRDLGYLAKCWRKSSKRLGWRFRRTYAAWMEGAFETDIALSQAAMSRDGRAIERVSNLQIELTLNAPAVAGLGTRFAARRAAPEAQVPDKKGQKKWRRGWDSNPRAGITRPSDFESAPL
jgi:hypothetical protein